MKQLKPPSLNPLKRISEHGSYAFRCNQETIRKVKLLCIQRNQTISKFIAEAVAAKLEKELTC